MRAPRCFIYSGFKLVPMWLGNWDDLLMPSRSQLVHNLAYGIDITNCHPLALGEARSPL